MAEVVGSAGMFFDPHDPADIGRTIAEVSASPAVLERLKAQCLPRSAELSWARSAEQMLDLLKAHARRAA